MDRNLAVAVASCGTTNVMGLFERHVSPSVRELTGSAAGGRWGPPGAYSVLYLGRPTDSVVGEAYRHLVDDSENMTADQVLPRRLLRAKVDVTAILDLRKAENQAAVGLTLDDLMSYPGNYEGCRMIGSATHQLGLHGIIAPAATRLGETLALFELHVPASEQPELVGEEEWPHLPPDPRILRAAP